MKRQATFVLSMILINSVLWGIIGLALFLGGRSHSPNDKLAPLYAFYPVFLLLAFASFMFFTIMLRIARKESRGGDG